MMEARSVADELAQRSTSEGGDGVIVGRARWNAFSAENLLRGGAVGRRRP